MQFDIITIFPDFFDKFKEIGLIGSAIEKGIIKLNTYNLRDYTEDKYKTVDDRPFGGGKGMVMKPEPIYKAITHLKKSHPPVDRVIFLSPKGILFNQRLAKELASLNRLILVCGRYEGIDERVIILCADYEISIGDYILNGGEVAAMVIIEAVSRLIPGVIGSSESLEEESFNEFLLEYPQYTRPRVFMDLNVPDILLSGNHAEIEKWRKNQSIELTKKRRPDLYELYEKTLKNTS